MSTTGNAPQPDPRAAAEAWLSERELGFYAWVLSDLIAAGCPILDAFRICHDTFAHPRLRWMNAQAYGRVREGDSLTEAWSEPPARGGIDPTFIDYVSVGEEGGTIDELLRSYALAKLASTHETIATAVGRPRELIEFTRALTLRQNAGLPLLRSLQQVAELPSLAGLKPELLRLNDAVEGGSSLSEALKLLEGTPLKVDQLYLKLIQAGEIGGVLDLMLNRLAAQAEPIRGG